MHASRFALTPTRSDCTAVVFQILKLPVKANVDPLSSPYRQISVFWRLPTPTEQLDATDWWPRNQDFQWQWTLLARTSFIQLSHAPILNAALHALYDHGIACHHMSTSIPNAMLDW